MAFEVMGSKQEYSLFCSGRSELSRVNGDSRSVFMKRVKAITPGLPLPIKRFVINDNCYSFGPLLVFKKKEWKENVSTEEKSSLARRITTQGATEEMKNYILVRVTNSDTIRLTNSGSYKCQVAFNWLEESAGVFSIDTNVLSLDEGETKEVKIWAFPTTPEVFRNTLIVCVSDHPEPMCFDMICSGVIPSIELEGPWKVALEAELVEADAAVVAASSVPKSDAKLIKELESKRDALRAGTGNDALPIPFERMLVGRTDIRSFTVTNTCDLPVALVIDPMDFTDSPNITISLATGSLAPGAMTTIVVTFFSNDPLIATGTFALKYADVEGGLFDSNRTTVRKFSVTAEAYKITAVSLTSAGEETGGNEIDFGVVRVGDYAHQSAKMLNKGKYKISYKISFKRQASASLLELSPMEGEIEAGESVDINLIFCAKTSAVSFVSNKDVRITISEPTTGEHVEEFPLYISGIAVFSKFRMQPARGTSFGAVRFDSATGDKHVELRNEVKSRMSTDVFKNFI